MLIMFLSVIQLAWDLVISAIKAIWDHFTSRQYPADWNLAFHLQFSILRQLQASMVSWTVEEARIHRYAKLNLQMQSFPWGKIMPHPKGNWVIPISIELPEAERLLITSEMRKAIQKLGPGLQEVEVKATSVQAEWQGPIQTGIKESALGEAKDRFEAYSETIKDGPIILYLHGGGYVAGSAESERAATFKLSQLCGGRVLSVNYRLAPQDPFPAALIDALIAYKYLIDPPEEALHPPINPKKIVIAGASAGVLSPLL